MVRSGLDAASGRPSHFLPVSRLTLWEITTLLTLLFKMSFSIYLNAISALIAEDSVFSPIP